MNTSYVWNAAAHYLASSEDHRTRQGSWMRGKLFVAAAKAYVPENGTILDYGCGPGRLAVLLAQRGFQVVGLDPSPGMIAAARHQRLDGIDVQFSLIADDVQSLPVDRFDAIVCSSVIEYIEQPGELLTSFRSSLHRCGVLIISFANSKSIWRKCLPALAPFSWRTVQRHVWCWDAFERLLSAAGFEAVTGPQYFESVCDSSKAIQPLSRLPLLGMLGLVVARKCDGSPSTNSGRVNVRTERPCSLRSSGAG